MLFYDDFADYFEGLSLCVRTGGVKETEELPKGKSRILLKNAACKSSLITKSY